MSQIAKPSIIRRIGQAVVTIGFIGVAALAVVVGSDFLAKRASAVSNIQEASAVPVSVSMVELDDHYTTTRSFLGQVEASADAVISFEIGGRLVNLQADEGDDVAKGDIIAKLDTDLLEAERTRLTASQEATSAQLKFAQTRLERAIELQTEGFTSRETLDQAQATRDELQGRMAEIDALMTSNTINLEKAEIAVGLPLGLPVEALSEVSIDIDGTQFPAALERLRPDVDPVTRTRTAVFERMPCNRDRAASGRFWWCRTMSCAPPMLKFSTLKVIALMYAELSIQMRRSFAPEPIVWCPVNK